MEWVRKAIGSAVVVRNGRREVLLLRRAYPPHDWVLPGGNAEPNESPIDTAIREVFEETGLLLTLEGMTGVYYQTDHRAGEFIHFTFSALLPSGARIKPDPAEVAESGFFPLDRLPEPMSAATRTRLLDALSDEPQRLPITIPVSPLRGHPR